MQILFHISKPMHWQGVLGLDGIWGRFCMKCFIGFCPILCSALKGARMCLVILWFCAMFGVFRWWSRRGNRFGLCGEWQLIDHAHFLSEFFWMLIRYMIAIYYSKDFLIFFVIDLMLFLLIMMEFFSMRIVNEIFAICSITTFLESAIFTIRFCRNWIIFCFQFSSYYQWYSEV